jgi:hypothetical protein
MLQGELETWFIRLDAISLFIRGRISWAALRLALGTRQAAVAGRQGGEIICRKVARDLGPF